MPAPTQAIADKNAAFEAMSPEQKRITIAKDVLAQLDAERSKRQIEVVSGTYFVFPDFSLAAGSQLQEAFLASDVKCEVCALGAIFAVKVLNYNGYIVPEGVQDDEGTCLCDVQMVENLEGIFTEDQLFIIENAFETDVLNRHDDENHDLNRAADMYIGIENPEERLRLIMENIIANNGEFVVN